MNHLHLNKNWIEINDDSHGTYNANSEIKFKSSTLKSILCECSNEYLLVTEPISVVGVGANLAARQAGRNDKEIILKN